MGCIKLYRYKIIQPRYCPSGDLSFSIFTGLLHFKCSISIQPRIISSNEQYQHGCANIQRVFSLLEAQTSSNINVSQQRNTSVRI